MTEPIDQPALFPAVAEQIVADPSFHATNVDTIVENFVARAGDSVYSEDSGPFWIVTTDGLPMDDYFERHEAEAALQDGQAVIDLTEHLRAVSLAAAKSVRPTVVQALVTLTIAPRLGQTKEDAADEFLKLFREYLTQDDSVFRSDYGTTVDELAAHRVDPDNSEYPTWGGYEGPYALSTVVQGITPAPTEAA